jgi:hypothetical protein
MKQRLHTERKKTPSPKRETPLSPGRWESVKLVRNVFSDTHKKWGWYAFLYREHPENNPENKIV